MDKAKDAGLTTEVLQNDFVTVLRNEKDILIIRWERQISLAERKQIFTWAKRFSVENDTPNWLIDDEAIYIITSEERDWIENEWPPMAAEAGIKKIAVYFPETFYSGLLTLTDFTQRAQTNYERLGVTQHEVFLDYQLALTWLNS